MNVNFNIIMDFFRIFLISIFTYYNALRMIKHNNQKIKKVILNMIIILVISMSCIVIKNSMGFLYSIISLVILLSFIVAKTTQNTVIYSIFLTTLSLGINYSILTVAGVITYFIKSIFYVHNKCIEISLLLLIYILFMHICFRIKRLKNGFGFLQNELVKEYISVSNLNISISVISLIVMFRDCKEDDETKLLIGLFCIIVILFLTIQKSFELYYKQKLLIKDLDETKEELAKTKEELAKAEKENLEASKRSHSLVHRQKALEFQISELRKSKNSKDINKIKQDVENLSKELYGKEVMTQLSKTNIELIDNMFRYMQFECYKNEIRFDLQICGNIYKMTNNVINKETLEILLADHIKNAIIAVKHSENSNKSILVKLGKIDDCYGVCIYDSGIEFKEETLKTLGKKPSSTHLDEGGSGMGFLNTFDTLNKYKASLIIDEIGMPCEENYTKVIMIKFDGKNEFKVNSYRQQKAV